MDHARSKNKRNKRDINVWRYLVLVINIEKEKQNFHITTHLWHLFIVIAEIPAGLEVMFESFYHKGLTSTFWDSWQLCEETRPLRYIYLVFVKIEKEYWILVPSGLICSHWHKLLRHLIPPYSYIFTCYCYILYWN